ncbi:uncharacterized protein [Macaca nemestrina]|uniref:uncharacterized protein isoform X2 n=1 Tax=Macaca nemestrina TaxID=9545 RepID=UPI0039B94BCF
MVSTCLILYMLYYWGLQPLGQKPVLVCGLLGTGPHSKRLELGSFIGPPPPPEESQEALRSPAWLHSAWHQHLLCFLSTTCVWNDKEGSTTSISSWL